MNNNTDGDDEAAGCMCNVLLSAGCTLDYCLRNIYGAMYLPQAPVEPILSLRALLFLLPEEGEIVAAAAAAEGCVNK